MKIVSMDGDFYRIRFPIVEEWLKYIHINKPVSTVANILITHDTGAEVRLLSHKEVEYVETFNGKIEESPALVTIRQDGKLDYPQMVSDHSCKLAIVPVLIPLDKEKKSMKFLFQRDNPDGTILQGGCWRNKFLRDTGSRGTLSWFAMDGKLILHDQWFEITKEDLLAWGSEFYF